MSRSARLVLSACREVHASGRPLTPEAVAVVLDRRGQLDEVVGLIRLHLVLRCLGRDQAFRVELARFAGG